MPSFSHRRQSRVSAAMGWPATTAWRQISLDGSAGLVTPTWFIYRRMPHIADGIMAGLFHLKL